HLSSKVSRAQRRASTSVVRSSPSVGPFSRGSSSRSMNMSARRAVAMAASSSTGRLAHKRFWTHHDESNEDSGARGAPVGPFSSRADGADLRSESQDARPPRVESISYSQPSADQKESEMRRMWDITRWICALIAGGGGIGILIWSGVLLTESINLAQHGEVRVAAVLDTAPSGKDGQYLLSFNVGSERVLIWSSEVGRHQAGDAWRLMRDDRKNA